MAGYGKRPTKTKFIMFCILNFSRGSLDYEEELSVVFFLADLPREMLVFIDEMG